MAVVLCLFPLLFLVGFRQAGRSATSKAELSATRGTAATRVRGPGRRTLACDPARAAGRRGSCARPGPQTQNPTTGPGHAHQTHHAADLGVAARRRRDDGAHTARLPLVAARARRVVPRVGRARGVHAADNHRRSDHAVSDHAAHGLPRVDHGCAPGSRDAGREREPRPSARLQGLPRGCRGAACVWRRNTFPPHAALPTTTPRDHQGPEQRPPGGGGLPHRLCFCLSRRGCGRRGWFWRGFDWSARAVATPPGHTAPSRAPGPFASFVS